MPLEIRDREGRRIRGASVNLVGGTCLGYLIVLALALIGMFYTIGTLISAVFGS